MPVVDRQRKNFDGNERVDLPDFRDMMLNAFADFKLLIKSYIDDSARRIIKFYKEGTHSGLIFKVKLDNVRAFHDYQQEWVYESAEAASSVKNVTLLPSTTNYIEVSAQNVLDDLQTRAFWDTDIGVSGEEVFDDINVRRQVLENIAVNQSGFTAGAVPLWTVVTDGVGIVSIVRDQDLIWSPRVTSLPSTEATRSTVYDSIRDLRSFIDYLGALVSEVKGGVQKFASIPWSSLKLLKEYQNLFINGGGTVSWEVPTSNQLAWSAAFQIEIAGRNAYTITAGNVTLTNGQCMYVVIPENSGGGALTPVVSLMSAVPIDPSGAGFQKGVQVLFLRRGTQITGLMEMPDLDSGESAQVGQDLPSALRTKLGIISETAVKSLTSTVIISNSDDYADRFSKLDDAYGTFAANLPRYNRFTGTGSQTDFVCTTVNPFNPSNAVFDIEVFVDGRRMEIDPAGGSAEDWVKVSNNTVRFTVAPPLGKKITVWRQGVNSGGINPPTVGKLWSDPVDANIIPQATNFYTAGNAASRFKEGHFKDLFVDRIVFKGTPGDSSQIKSLYNATGSAIAAFKPISKYSDGSIYPCDSDSTQGQNFVGITLDAIANGAAGRVVLVGKNLPGALTGLGFAPGADIFLAENGSYTNDVSGFSGANDSIIKLGVADCAEGVASATATDLIMFVEVIGRP